MKCCKLCNEPKDFSEFTFRKDRNMYDSYCKMCRKEYYKEKNYIRKDYQKNYKRVIDKKRKEYLKNYLKLNRKKYKKYDKQNRAIYDLVRRVLKYKSEKKSQEKNKTLGWSKLEFLEKIGIIKDDEHLDHKIPMTWFITNTPMNIINHLDNLQILAKEKNLSKGNRYSHIVSSEFLIQVSPYVKEKYKSKLLKNCS
jgi:hypothetical protein